MIPVLIPVPSASIPGIESIVAAYAKVIPERIVNAEPIFLSGSTRSSKMLTQLGILHERLHVAAINSTSAIAATVEEYFKSERDIGDTVVVLPPVWWPTCVLNLSGAIDVLHSDESVKMIRLAGLPMAHASGKCGYTTRGYSDKFVQLYALNISCPHVIDPTCPFIARTSEFKYGGTLHELSHIACEAYLRSNNFGLTDRSRVLAPSAVKRSIDDDRKELFVDVVGINRKYRDRCPNYDSEIASISGISFTSNLF